MKGVSVEKMAMQLQTSISERHGGDADVFLVVMCAMVFEEGETPKMHHATAAPQAVPEGEDFYRDTILGAVQTLAEEVRNPDPAGESRRFDR